ncbi:hypothetical protein [Caulobacter mirabilis]|uniref:Uncharacterized protein n=1 Tax=Caulobacter mirabilis TaxID=69666 RepID=A0A2D2AY98_9CAUL|nr:hypothetical protein [Caulobacter mirabilis]ATQ42990.1 hypothetical protein CSW64_11505 [Caulobacter mirabilis]
MNLRVVTGLSLAVLLASAASAWAGDGQQMLSPPPPHPDLLEVPPTELEYSDVASALAAVRAKPGVKRGELRGWATYSDESASTIWQFAPESHPAYPALVKLRMVKLKRALVVEVHVLCDVRGAICDELRVAKDKEIEALARASAQEADRKAAARPASRP